MAKQSKFVALRMTPADKALVELAAQANKQSVTQFTISALRKAAYHAVAMELMEVPSPMGESILRALGDKRVPEVAAAFQEYLEKMQKFASVLGGDVEYFAQQEGQDGTH